MQLGYLRFPKTSTGIQYHISNLIFGYEKKCKNDPHFWLALVFHIYLFEDIFCFNFSRPTICIYIFRTDSKENENYIFM